MTTQEEIREGIAIVVGCFAFNKPWCSLTEEQQITSNACAGEILARLHSQGVVIRVEGELPKPNWNVPIAQWERQAELWQCRQAGYADSQNDMLKAGYVAVEPLL